MIQSKPHSHGPAATPPPAPSFLRQYKTTKAATGQDENKTRLAGEKGQDVLCHLGSFGQAFSENDRPARPAQDLTASGMAGATFNAHIGLLRLVWRVLRKKAKTERKGR